MSEVEGQLESYTNVDLGGGQSTEATGEDLNYHEKEKR